MSSRKATPEEQKENLTALEEIKKLFPTINDHEIGEFLISATAYPFNSLVGCLPQIRELAAQSGGDWEKAIGVSHSEMDAEMDRINSLTPGQKKDWESSNLNLKEFSDLHKLGLYEDQPNTDHQ